MKPPSANALLDALRKSLAPDGRPGPGWYTTTELAVELQRDRNFVVRIAKERGWPRQVGTAMDETGRRRVVTYYQIGP